MNTREAAIRSRIMRSVGTRNTGPELAVRRALRAMRLGYRLHARDLPGTPDIVLRGRRVAIFVHGCFWHGHDCPKGRPPRSRPDYWLPKLETNAARDRTKIEQLESLGWRCEVIWQCEAKDSGALTNRLSRLFDAETIGPRRRPRSGASTAPNERE